MIRARIAAGRDESLHESVAALSGGVFAWFRQVPCDSTSRAWEPPWGQGCQICRFLDERSGQRKQEALRLSGTSAAGYDNVRLIPDDGFQRLKLVKMEIKLGREETLSDEICEVGNVLVPPEPVEKGGGGGRECPGCC